MVKTIYTKNLYIKTVTPSTQSILYNFYCVSRRVRDAKGEKNKISTHSFLLKHTDDKLKAIFKMTNPPILQLC